MIGKISITVAAIFLFSAFALFIWIGAANAADDPDQLVQIAWQTNPSVASLTEKIEAARQRVPQAGVWADPMLAVEYSNVPVDTFALGDHPMSGVQLKLQQTFPFPGTTGKRKAVAEAMTGVARFDLKEKQNQIRAMVKRAYWNLTLVRHLRVITEQHVQEIDDLVVSVNSRYQTGAAGQHDLLRLMVLRDRLIDDLDDFNRKEATVLASLNTLLNRAPDEPVQTPAKVEPAVVSMPEQEAWDSAQKSHPLVLAKTEQAKADRLGAERASYEGWPDPTVWVGYRFREEITNPQGMVTDKGIDFFTAGLSIPIPVFNGSRWGAAEREKLAQKRSAQSDRAAIAEQIRGELRTAYASWQRAISKSKTYAETIQPVQKQTLQATLAAYQVGRADFTSLYAAEVGLLDVERELIKAKSETWIQQANVETLVGAGIPDQGESK